jgi:hypothetical protein
VNRQGFDAAIFLGNFVEDIKYADTFGRYINRHLVGSGDSDESYIPAAKMIAALVALTGKPAYKYRAFELLVTLDLYIYKATRRLIVPADIDFDQLHILLQRAFRWDNYHLYQFEVLSRKGAKKSLLRIMPIEEDDFFYDGEAKHSADVKLSDCFPAYKFIRYTYDFGDSWEHEIKLVRVIDEHHEESPFLLEAEGQSPPEDIGGVYGFVQFHEAFMNPEHPSHEEMKEWVGNWSPELYDWEKRPRVL